MACSNTTWVQDSMSGWYYECLWGRTSCFPMLDSFMTHSWVAIKLYFQTELLIDGKKCTKTTQIFH